MKAKLINDMYLQKRHHESTIQEEQSKSEKLSAQISRLKSALPNVIELVRQQKDNLNRLRKEVCHYQMSSKKTVKNTVANVHKVTRRIKKKVKFPFLLFQPSQFSTNICAGQCNGLEHII